MTGWMPIESAPRDGNDVIVGFNCGGTWIVRNARFVRADEWVHKHDDVDGWWSPSSSCGQDLLEGTYAPTHWMTMPEEPTR